MVFLDYNQTINRNRKERMSKDINDKQSFLHREIIQGGYDPQIFLSFIVQRNPQAKDNLQLWGIQELKQAVEIFKANNRMVQSQSQEKMLSEMNFKQENQSKGQDQSNKIVQKQGENSKKVKENDKNEGKYSQIIKCKKKVINEKVFNQNSKALMINYEKMQGGMFEKSYVIYQIFVQPFKVKIRRRYSDFQWLREKLQFLCPGFPIPPVSKKGNFRRFDDKYVKKRMLILQKFLDKMFNIVQLRTQHIFYQFLTITDKVQFQKYKNNYKDLQKPVETSQMCTLEGSLKLQIDKQSTNFLMQTQTYITEIQPHIKKYIQQLDRIYKDFKACATALQTCSQTYKSIGATCNKLWIFDNDFRVSNQLPILQNNIFSNFQHITTQSSLLLQQQAALLRKELHSMFKYENLCIINLSDSLRILGQRQMEFFQMRTALLKKKMRLYDEGNISKWGCQVKLTQKPVSKDVAFGIMLVKETNEAKKMRQSYALYNVQLHSECQRYFKQNNRFLGKYAKRYVQSLSRLNNQSLMIWVDTLSSVMGMQQDKKIIIASI